MKPLNTPNKLEARRDQLVSDLCQLRLDELGASQMGDDAGAAEAAALMDAVQRELTEVEQAILQNRDGTVPAERPAAPATELPTER
jgi:hypothetical protein